ncbi:hypothetical protein BHM03_00031793 [Ensete ventricosum]|uniref:Uncharacterized protein n=1 Tax=Ensete ventricosum TaxID=4639 RepID=A0A445MII9_ENSVE|nr:hypothetical protein BHM03_00031793 [Ensete ventricosum]
MLRPGVTQEWVDEGATRSSTSVNNTKARRAMDSRSECHSTVEAGLPCVCIEACIRWKPWSSAYGAVYHLGSSLITSTSESHGRDLIILRYDRSSWRVGLFQCSHSLKGDQQVRGQIRVVGRGEEATTRLVGLSYPKAKRRLERSWNRRSTTVPQRRIYRSRRKGCRCKSMDSRAMGLVAPWYCRGGTSVESSIPCSHGGRALVVKGVEEVQNAKANSKYQDMAEG